MDFNSAAPFRIKSNSTGRLVLGVTSQLGGAVPEHFTDFLAELRRVESKNLILLGPPPYPKVDGMDAMGIGVEGELDLVHGRTGKTSTRLFMLYDPALVSSSRRRRRVQALTGFSPLSSIVLVGGARVGGSRTQTVEHIGSAWVVQVGVFNPLEGVDRITQITRAGHKLDPSYGGTILRIDLDDHDCPVTPTFRDYSW